MKVIRVVPFLDFGGVEKRVQLTAEGFSKKKSVNLTIVVLGHGGRISEAMAKAGFNVKVLNENPKIPNFPLINRLITIFKELKPDVIHTSGAEANFHGLVSGRMAKVPVRVGEEVGFPQHDWKWRMVFRFTYRFAHKVIGISEAVKQKIVGMGEVGAEKVRVIYNPVSISENGEAGLANKVLNTYQKNNDGQKPFIFITTCRLVPIKNLDMLVSVFSELTKGEVQKPMELWIVGDGPEKEKLKELANKSGIMGKVKFWGFQEDVFPFLRKSDAFVLPSFSEGFSISLVEAMGCALPSIATKEGGPSEIIKEETGFLIDPNNENELREKMQKVLNLPYIERKALGLRAKNDVEKRFSVEKYIDELIGVYGGLEISE